MLLNLPRLAKGYQPIFLDYRVDPIPRYGYGRPAHPELTAPNGDLVVTYATNSFDFADLFTPDGVLHLGWPRFVRIPRSEPR